MARPQRRSSTSLEPLALPRRGAPARPPGPARAAGAGRSDLRGRPGVGPARLDDLAPQRRVRVPPPLPPANRGSLHALPRDAPSIETEVDAREVDHERHRRRGAAQPLRRRRRARHRPLGPRRRRPSHPDPVPLPPRLRRPLPGLRRVPQRRRPRRPQARNTGTPAGPAQELKLRVAAETSQNTRSEAPAERFERHPRLPLNAKPARRARRPALHRGRRGGRGRAARRRGTSAG